jgi:hypothetical protein
MNTLKAIALERKTIISQLMPDTCRIYPRTGGVTQDHGITTPVPPTARTWRTVAGTPILDVPCRADLSRAFRPDKLREQATEVDEYNLELPFDMVFDPTDYIIITYKGLPNRFEIRKVKDISNWDASIECVIDQSGTTFDYP